MKMSVPDHFADVGKMLSVLYTFADENVTYT